MTGWRVTLVESWARLNSVNAALSCVAALVTASACPCGIRLSASVRLMMLS
jgi:hypothetical protein